MSEYDSDKLREIDCDDECCGVRWEAADIIDAKDKRIAELEAVVNEQAEDEGLWFIARTAPEGYLQAALRKLHRLIEGDSK